RGLHIDGPIIDENALSGVATGNSQGVAVDVLVRLDLAEVAGGQERFEDGAEPEGPHPMLVQLARFVVEREEPEPSVAASDCTHSRVSPSTRDCANMRVLKSSGEKDRRVWKTVFSMYDSRLSRPVSKAVFTMPWRV